MVRHQGTAGSGAVERKAPRVPPVLNKVKESSQGRLRDLRITDGIHASNSIDEKHIDTFSASWKQRRYSSNQKL
jgi:hypothetical protein